MIITTPLRKGLTWFLFSVCALLMIAPVLAADHTSNVSSNEFTENKLNVSVDAKNPAFSIKLKSNPTTGYSWFLRGYDADLVTPLKHGFQSAEHMLIGSPGYEIWTFKMKPAAFVVPQQTTIRFVYARPWQGSDDSKQLVFSITTSK